MRRSLLRLCVGSAVPDVQDVSSGTHFNTAQRPFPKSVSAQLELLKNKNAYTSNCWLTLTQLRGIDAAAAEKAVPDVLYVCGQKLSLLNASQLKKGELNQLGAKNMASRFGAFRSVSMGVFPEDLTLKMAAQAVEHGFKSPYWVTERQALDVFGVEIKPDQLPVEHVFQGYKNEGEDFNTAFYNAEQTTDPSVFNSTNCRRFIALTLRKTRFPPRMVRAMWRHCIQEKLFSNEKQPYLPYWGTASKFKSLCKVDVSEEATPFMMVMENSGEIIELFNASQVTDPSKVQSAIATEAPADKGNFRKKKKNYSPNTPSSHSRMPSEYSGLSVDELAELLSQSGEQNPEGSPSEIA